MVDTKLKPWILTIHEVDKEMGKSIVNSVDGENLVEVLAKLPLLIIEIQKRLEAEATKYYDQDIPF